MLRKYFDIFSLTSGSTIVPGRFNMSGSLPYVESFGAFVFDLGESLLRPGRDGSPGLRQAFVS
jgi:hypothetical protein